MSTGWGEGAGWWQRTHVHEAGQGGLGATNPLTLEEEAQLGRMLVPGWDQTVRSWRGPGRAGWVAIWKSFQPGAPA